MYPSCNWLSLFFLLNLCRLWKKLSFDVIGIYDASNQSYRLFIKKQSYTTSHSLYFVTRLQVVLFIRRDHQMGHSVIVCPRCRGLDNSTFCCRTGWKFSSIAFGLYINSTNHNRHNSGCDHLFLKVPLDSWPLFSWWYYYYSTDSYYESVATDNHKYHFLFFGNNMTV